MLLAGAEKETPSNLYLTYVIKVRRVDWLTGASLSAGGFQSTRPFRPSSAADGEQPITPGASDGGEESLPVSL